MTIAVLPTRKDSRESPQLHSGDRMTQEEFHRIYTRMPRHFKAELIGGTVYVASPLGRAHGTTHPPFTTVLFAYAGSTPGVEVADNTTVVLGPDAEPQPDLLVRILPEFGGQSRTNREDYVIGPPELVAEVAHSSRAIDLHAKRPDYRRYGVHEYLVAVVAERRLYWFDLRQDEELAAAPDGVVRVRTFPGLWIDVEAMFAKDYQRLMTVLQQGLATAEHAKFVKRLAGTQPRREAAGKSTKPRPRRPKRRP